MTNQHQITVSSTQMRNLETLAYEYAYRALCSGPSCDWRDRRTFPLTPAGRDQAALRGQQHVEHQERVARITAPREAR